MKRIVGWLLSVLMLVPLLLGSTVSASDGSPQRHTDIPTWGWIAICGGAGILGALAVLGVQKRK